MPFKLKIKKSRHYNVVSKSLFVISVEILDGTVVECTLSSESTGQDCLDIVCQKLSINQPKFFGLQYLVRNSDSFYWIDLERPIKRQLDKYGRGLSVQLRVMYYVRTGVRLLYDEVTRYQYFLQLKMDVIEGKISCTPKEAVELASYCMQAEFGNFNAERHTSHYLKDFQLFPRVFADTGLLQSLTESASRQHAALYNLSQGTAEEYYICACQKLQGYGQEVYSVKDNLGEDSIISVSLTGISVSYLISRRGKHYGWADISNIINHKRNFTIELVGGTEKIEFHFPNVDSAKNAWRFCVLQHTFYRQYETGTANERLGNNDPTPPQQTTSLYDRLRQTESLEELPNNSQRDIQMSTQSLVQRAQSTSCLDLNKSKDVETIKKFLPSYRPAPDYETAVQIKYRNSSVIPCQETSRANHNLYASETDIHQNDSYSAQVNEINFAHSKLSYKNRKVDFSNSIKMLHLYEPPIVYPTKRTVSNSTPDLSGVLEHTKPQSHLFSNIVSGSSPDLATGGNFYLKQMGQFYATYEPRPIHRSQSYLPPQAATYENLAPVFSSNLLGVGQAVIVENPNVTRHIKKVHDEHGNVLYYMPTNILQENELPSSGIVVTRSQKSILTSDSHVNTSTEPIYENLPLAWQNEVTALSQGSNQYIHRTEIDGMQSKFEKLQMTREQESLYANLEYCDRNANDTLEISKSSQRLQEAESANSFLSNTSLVSENDNSPGQSKKLEKTLLNITRESFSRNSLNSNNSSEKAERKRWAILGGKNKHLEKIKSATLGREKEKNRSTNNQRPPTGLQKCNPLPPSMNKEMMCQVLERALEGSQITFEFDRIPRKKLNASYTTASLPENAAFNRYKDVLPYEENRLRLTPSKNNKFGYVNASHITITVGNTQRFYIATQGPTRATLPYFWQCVWEAEVYLIIQLTDSSEDIQYLPDTNNRYIDISKEFQVWWVFSQKTDFCVTSKIKLCHVTSRRYRTLWHLQYTDWGDQGCPRQESHFLGFLEEMKSVYQYSMGEIPPGHNKNSPVLVHCTAGVGRTGLTIICDLLIDIVSHNQEVCIPRMVELLRQQRVYMVQTIAQYKFLYTLLIHCLKQTRLI